MVWSVLLLSALCGLSVAQPLLKHPDWLQFKVDHGKSYENEMEEITRNKIFLDNLNKIREHNELYEKGLKTFTLKMNKFGDLTAEEFKALLKGLGDSRPSNTAAVSMTLNASLPSSVDWRSKGAVTPVKDQAQCGSCWAFSTTGTLEGQLFLKTGKLVSLSEQNLMDCSGGQGNMGCSGGWPDWAINYVTKNGIDTEQSYPYQGEDSQCRFKKEGALLAGTKPIRLPQSESELQKAVANIGPVSVCIDAGHDSFQLYGSGVYYEESCSTDILDHAVLAVGYGSLNGHDYWLVKNSWGESWGNSGYILMSRNKNNNCGIVSRAVYPVLP